MVELRLLFWNLNRSSSAVDHVAALCEELDPHLLLTAETGSRDELVRMCAGLRSVSAIDPVRVETFRWAQGFHIEARFATQRAEGFVVDRPGVEPHLLVAVHLESQLWQRSGDQEQAADQLHRTIESWEQELGHHRTVVIGDFNMDPFSPAMVSLRGLNALMTRRRASRGEGTRTVRGDERPTFYNPMWNCFGDREGPPGTYYWSSTTVLGYFWHMLDQILVRGELADAVSEVRVLTASRLGSLLSGQGLPSRDISDHLPLFVRLDLDNQP